MDNFTEVGLIWPAKEGSKASATGRIVTACDIVLKPEDRFFVIPIKYENGRPNDKAPTSRLVLVRGDGQRSGGGYSATDDDIQF